MRDAIYPIIGAMATLAIILLMGFGIIIWSQPEKTVADCSSKTGANVIQLDARDDSFGLSASFASQCDILRAANNSGSFFSVAFGEHNEHYPYSGYTESTIRPGEIMDILLAEAGTFRLHNHYDENQAIQFTIEKDDSLEQSAAAHE